MKYTIFIDESGDFTTDKGKWIISGFLCVSDYDSSIKSINDICKNIPEKIEVQSIKDCHLTEFRKKLGHVEALKKVAIVFNQLESLPFQYYFISSINGQKIQIDHREKTYRMMLFDMLSAIEMLIAEEEEIEQLTIVIAQRTIDGKRQNSNEIIRKNVLNQLPKALEEDLVSRGMVDLVGNKIDIKIEYANDVWGLVIADFIANITYNGNQSEEKKILSNWQKNQKYFPVQSFSGYKERRANVALRNKDYALACLRWLLIWDSNNDDISEQQLLMALNLLFTSLGTTGANLSFESLLDKIWRLHKKEKKYDECIRLLQKLKDTIAKLTSTTKELNIFIFRINILLLKIINHLGKTNEAEKLLDEQRRLFDAVKVNPDHLNLIFENSLIESEVYYNKLDMDKSYQTAEQYYKLVESYIELFEVVWNDENIDINDSVYYQKALMNYLRHAVYQFDKENELEDILDKLNELEQYLQSGYLSRFRVIKTKILLKLNRYEEAIEVTNKLVIENKDGNEFDKLAYIKAVNHYLIVNKSVKKEDEKQIKIFLSESKINDKHPYELIYRELAIFQYLHGDFANAKKLIGKSSELINQKSSKIEELFFNDNEFIKSIILQDKVTYDDEKFKQIILSSIW